MIALTTSVCRSGIGLTGWWRAVALMAALFAVVGLAWMGNGVWAGAPADNTDGNPAAEGKAKADMLFEQKNYKDAAAAYADFLSKAQPGKDAWEATMRQVQCQLLLQLFDAALAAAEAAPARFAGRLEEARAYRFVGNLYLVIPHWGYENAGKITRGQHGKGRYVQTFKMDAAKAIAHLEKARERYIALLADTKFVAGLPEAEQTAIPLERLECNFDLTAAVTRFGPYDMNGDYGWWGGEEAEESDGTVGEEEVIHDGPRFRGRRGWGPQRPRGVPMDAQGNPVFEPIPAEYSVKLTPGQKMKFLLAEVEKLDASKNKELAARAVYRKAMLARVRYGAERLQNWMWQDFGAGTLNDQMKSLRPWELADNQVITLVGSKLKVVTLPADEDILALLNSVVQKYPDSGVADEAQYARGVYYQTRQQFNEALREYDLLKTGFPNSRHISAAAANRSDILAKQAGTTQTGVQLAGQPARMPITHRNTNRMDFVAYELDLHRLISDSMKELESNPQNWRDAVRNLGWALVHDHDQHRNVRRRYQGKEVARWSVELKDDGSHRPATTETVTPLKDRGCYIVEGSVPGGNNTRNVILLQDLAIVEKQVQNKRLYWTVDARTGRPVETELDFVEYSTWWDNNGRQQNWVTHRWQTKTNDAGVFEFTPQGKHRNQHCQLVTVARTADGRLALAGQQWWNIWHGYQDDVWAGDRTLMVTDRPVYRPAQTVNFKVWNRRIVKGEYQPVAAERLHLVITDARGNKVYDKTLPTDAFGGVSDKFELKADAALGMYTAAIQVNGRWTQLGGNQFRVEEYKKPEYEVTVDTAKSRAKLGEKIDVKIAARYYFGAPVTEATVSYKVFRTSYEHKFTSAGEWDWLYGIGYGRCWYPYAWLPGWGKWCCRPMFWYPWWGPMPQPERELVAEGQGNIAADGTFSVTVDTAKAAREHADTDHRYTVEAEVRDSSRRVITGSGSITATRQEFYAFVEADRGYYNPGNQAFFRVRTMTADNSARAVKGTASISRISYVGENGAKIVEEPIKSWTAETDADGRLDFSVRTEQSGQFKVAFSAKDSWGGTVEGAAVIWVAGNDFDGSVYRFGDLELITDKRTYKVGETVRLMINARDAGAVVLFSDSVQQGNLSSYKMIHLPRKSKIIDIPVTDKHVPNFFVEATRVLDGKLHQEVRDIPVPPERGMINVSVTADKPEYRPGSKGKITIKTTDPEGKPVSTQVALTAFDKSVLYIQGELTPDIKSHFWGRKRQHFPQATTSLNQTFNAVYQMSHPETNLHGYPDAWWGSWGRRHLGMFGTADESFAEMAFGENRLAARSSPQAAGMDAVAASRAPGLAKEASSNSLRSGANALQDFDGNRQGSEKQDGMPAPAPAFAEATVRSNFADTALWLPSLTTNDLGEATAEITFPENLTGWNIKAWGMTAGTRVGSGQTAAVTTKNLLLRLQAPRFFVETDEVVLSAIVHNYLKTEKTARVSINVDSKLMTLMSDATVDVKVAAGGEKRVDWLVRVTGEGKAKIRMTALTDEESDAMEMTFPVLVHGIDKMVATVGSILPNQSGEKTVTLVVPEERKPAATKLEVRFSPSLAGAMIDAVPYLISYPYGCTEQTMSRFLPAVVTAKTLQNMGIKLEDVRQQAVNLNAQELGKPRSDRWKPQYYAQSPVFDSAELRKVIDAGLDRLYGFQRPNGGWGWWKDDEVNPYLTAYVLYGLLTAEDCDVPVRKDVIQRGLAALQGAVKTEVDELKAEKLALAAAKTIEEKEKIRSVRRWWYYNHDTMAFQAFVLSQRKIRDDELMALLLADRDQLSLYGKSMLALAYHKLGAADNAKLLLQNIKQWKEEDKENETVWFRTPQQGWWYWWNNDIETNAYVLKALSAIEPTGTDAPRLVKWLLNNRRHGTYWRSTRDTAICVQAMSDYIRASGEAKTDYVLNVRLNGKLVKSVKINKDNFFSFDNSLTIEGEALTSGKHQLSITRDGEGAVYYSAYLSYFTKEQDIKGAGLELKVNRTYYRLDRIDADEEVKGANGQNVVEKRLRWKRTELKTGDKVSSGDLIEVELKLTAKNDYDYLCFEDYKPAGCEPTQLKSGARYGELCSHMELRDDRVVFFIGMLRQGDHIVKYRLRAETPGHFHALPTKGHAMYAPELACISDEMRLKIADK